MTKDTDQILAHYPVLKSIPNEDLLKALSGLRTVNLSSGAVVFEELQDCRAFPFVLDGNIRVFKRSENGREISLYNVTPGDVCVVTTACLLGDKPYNAVGMVQSDCRLVMIPSSGFDHLMSTKTFREFIFSLFSKRVLGLMQLIDEVAFHKLDQRLAKFLLDNGQELRASHQKLADELGSVREIITRILNAFSDQGLVSLKRGQIYILDLPRLKDIAGISSNVT